MTPSDVPKYSAPLSYTALVGPATTWVLSYTTDGSSRYVSYSSVLALLHMSGWEPAGTSSAIGSPVNLSRQ